MAFNGVKTADRLVKPSYGLFSVAQVANHSGRDNDWLAGFFVETEACSHETTGLPICISTDNSAYDIFNSEDDVAPFFHVVAFSIVERFNCDNSIGYNAIDRRKTVVNQLERVTEFAVEQELWLGTAAQLDGNPITAARWLASADDVTPTAGTGVKPEVAVALVEQEFAENNPGIQATIHITPLIAAALRKSFFFEESGVLRTANGSLVAISRGGVGNVGPASVGSGGSATEHWVYATGPVYVDLGAEDLVTVSSSEIVNPVTNAVSYVAERPAAVYFDGCSWFGAIADATL